ncbi:POU domain, class 5, transcription factor 3-like [Manacus candei]|uniref:POU domain, class 5, transcription factor 3-like n=1 Tax=Manacus candei TaxID=415023 RepID=UPI0022274A51|nr:POU domain, class 5, transcription factor 3-like [Manacus candei]
MPRASTVVRKKPEVGVGESGRGGSFGIRSSEDAALTQTSSLPPALGPTTGRDGAPAPPARAAPPGLRIAPGASPRCSHPSSAALLPSSRPPCPAPAAVWCRGRAQTPRAVQPCCKMDTEGSAGAGCAPGPGELPV